MRVALATGCLVSTCAHLIACERILTERDVVDLDLRSVWPADNLDDMDEGDREDSVLGQAPWHLFLCYRETDESVTCRHEAKRRWRTVWESDAPTTDLTWSPRGPVWIDPSDGAVRMDLLCDDDIDGMPGCTDGSLIDGLEGVAAVDVTTSWDQVCALDDAGEVSCGQGYEPELDFVPDRLRGGHAGYWTCALGDVGEVACWDGQGPVDLTWLPPDVVDVALSATPCALDVLGDVYCPFADRSRFFLPLFDQPPVQMARGVVSIRSTGRFLVMEREEDWLSVNAFSYAIGLQPGESCGLAEEGECRLLVHQGDWEQFARPCALSPDGTLRCQNDWSMGE